MAATEKTKSPSAKESLRKVTKPLMEKRRRARINDCLGQLKTLVLDAMNKDTTRHSKLEKADILHMTVKHLQNMQRQHTKATLTTDPVTIDNYRSGYRECIREIDKFMNTSPGIEPATKSNVLSHLSSCMQSVNNISPSQPLGVTPQLYVNQPNQMLSPNQACFSVQPLQMHLPTIATASYIPVQPLNFQNKHATTQTDLNNVSAVTLPTKDSSEPLGVHIVQENGGLAVVLPGQGHMTTTGQIPVIPLYTGSSQSFIRYEDQAQLCKTSAVVVSVNDPKEKYVQSKAISSSDISTQSNPTEKLTNSSQTCDRQEDIPNLKNDAISGRPPTSSVNYVNNGDSLPMKENRMVEQKLLNNKDTGNQRHTEDSPVKPLPVPVVPPGGDNMWRPW